MNAGENPDANRIMAGARSQETDSLNRILMPTVPERPRNFGFGEDNLTGAVEVSGPL